ncbi:shikimate kinase [Thermoflexibacter ruber]|uniref:Shikimate kinase n=1 Tax=Thermoflexibacter ruber TaxID=1003 RepID=A0A1I2FJC3_9BACT|nr:shikimate kinase [Thermoflexibacter ruber]SFF05093.1 shikimate kinase [Thermoflexibacter ruber]
MFPERIYLLGMPGSGKSTLSKQLAKEINYHFLDLDEWIVQHERNSISEIFAIKGEEYFREIERKALLHSLTLQKIVIATGGGTPCFFDNMQIIKNNGFSIFLDVPLEVLAQRVSKEVNTRPLLNTENKEVIDQLTEKYNHRLPFYRQAELTITGANLSVQDILQWLTYMDKI